MESIVSVIIPTYKGADNLARAVESVLEQTYNPVEVVVVDDNAPDSEERRETEAVMSLFLHRRNVKYIKHTRTKNGAAARNSGISVSSGNFLCFLDDEDFYLPERIEKSVALLEENPGYDGVYCGVVLTNNGNFKSIVKPGTPLEQKDLLLKGDSLGTGSNLFLTQRAVNFVTGFDENFIRHQDTEFMLRILENFKVINLDKILIVRAANGENNLLDYNKLRKVKELYMLKFEHAIERLLPDEKRKFFIRQYEDLFHAALKSGKKEYIYQGQRELKLFRDITFKDRILISISEKRLSKKKLYKKLRPVYDNSKNRALTHQLHRHLEPSEKEYIFNLLCRMETHTGS
ncbi:glycosyltransferase family 2 protein [Planococcus salinarum]|uniref:glycosyltransferase family 2 protein n=1 Tax=Planococcus salinarum TaxID=622695 RepID=UPI000E3E3401|nr:glycosyltransferase family 2 protein [Planococcus salinarum]TAA66474.1 glycosyltransferase family 2 protein [Planococcus salinarum]